MELLSLRTIIFIASGFGLMMGVYMLFLHNNAKGVKGPLHWAFANLLIGIGCSLRLLHPSNAYSNAFAMLFITVGLFLYLAGIWSFKEKELKMWVLIGFPAFDVVQTLFFTFMVPERRVRVALHLIILLIFSILAIYELLKLGPERRYLRKLFRLNAIAFMAFALVLVGGIIFVLFRPLGKVNVQYAWIIAFGLGGGIMTALTFGFLSAVNLQLYHELEGQLKTKTKFFSIITHDLMGPVGTLMGFLNLLNNEKDLKEEERIKFLANLEVLSQSTYHLLQNLLEWAKFSKNIAEYEIEMIDLNQLIVSNTKFFESLTLYKDIRLEFQHEGNASIMGNEKMIETVIRNLVSNAIKFTPKGGLIKITTENDANIVRLTVEDSGVGIPPEKLSQIFKLDNLSSTSGTDGESGSGLGLALCKDFVTRNHGTIRVESQVNAGSRFIIDFPQAE